MSTTATPSLQIQDLSDSGQLQVSLVQPGADVRAAPPVPFTLAFSPDERAALDRYHAEYLRPGVDALPRLAAVETAMRNLGRLLFELAFPAAGAARRLLDDALALAAGANPPELAIISPNPDFLSLPWELLNDPRLGYFVPGLAGVARQTTASIPSDQTDERAADVLNVLMLSPSPLDEAIPARGPLLAGPVIAGGSLASAAVTALEGLNSQASLDNPRPATLEAMRRLLERSPAHYHIAHLDGIALDAAGAVLLENETGASHPVPPAELGALLAAAGVKVALLSAGLQPDAPAAALWTRAALALAGAGVPQVALLPAPLHPDIAETAMRAFYTGLARGNDVAAAVAALRRELMNAPERLTIHGRRVSWDWQPPRRLSFPPLSAPRHRRTPPPTLWPPR